MGHHVKGLMDKISKLKEALREKVAGEFLGELDGLTYQMALGHAFTLLCESGVEDPEGYLKTKKILN